MSRRWRGDPTPGCCVVRTAPGRWRGEPTKVITSAHQATSARRRGEPRWVPHVRGIVGVDRISCYPVTRESEALRTLKVLGKGVAQA